MKKLVFMGLLLSLFCSMAHAQTQAERYEARVLELRNEYRNWAPMKSFTRLMLREGIGWTGATAKANNLLDSLNAAMGRLVEDVPTLRRLVNLVGKFERDVEKLVKDVQKESKASAAVIEWQRERLAEAVRFGQEILGAIDKYPKAYLVLALWKAEAEGYRMLLVLSNPLFLDFNEKEQTFFFRWNAEAWQKIKLGGKIVVPIFSVLPSSFSESIYLQVNGENQRLENGLLYYEYTPEEVGVGSVKISVYSEDPLTGKRSATAEVVQHYEVSKLD